MKIDDIPSFGLMLGKTHNFFKKLPLRLVYFTHEDSGSNDLYAVVVFEFKQVIVAGYNKVGFGLQGTG